MDPHFLSVSYIHARGGTRNFPMEGLTLVTRGLKLWFPGYYKCQKCMENGFHLPTWGLACSDESL